MAYKPLNSQVTTRQFDYGSLVRKEWGTEYNKPDVAYEFSNGRKFEDSTLQGGSFYVKTA